MCYDFKRQSRFYETLRLYLTSNMNYLEGRNSIFEGQRSRTSFTQGSTAVVKSGYLWKTSFHPGRTSSKSRYFVLTKSSLDHFRNHQTVTKCLFSVNGM